MPTHWTYTTYEPGDGLFQGDIIAREPLLGVLNEAHKHFCDAKYLAFIVLTQTCDLVLRRNESCKAKHIGLAVVRPLSALIPDLLHEMCGSPRIGVYSNNRREQAEQLLHRVLNQNEQAHGWVYLHPDGDVGIGEPAVAMLRINISLRANEHYEVIRKARCGRLDTEYRNKLGWLAGNLYSRIDTKDWSENESGDVTEEIIIKELLATPVSGRAPLWVPASWIAAVVSKKLTLGDLPLDEVEDVLRSNAPKSPMELALAEVKRIIDQMREEFMDGAASEFRARVNNDPCILPLLGKAIVHLVNEVTENQAWAFYEVIASDSVLLEVVASNLGQQATKFATRHGARNVGLFIDTLATTPILAEDAAGRVKTLGENACGEKWVDNSAQIDQLLRAMPAPPVLIEHLRGVAVSSVLQSLAERTVAKLTNRPDFKKNLKLE